MTHLPEAQTAHIPQKTRSRVRAVLSQIRWLWQQDLFASTLVGLGVLVVLFRFLWSMRLMPIGPFDEGFCLVYPDRILHGAVPNRDFFSAYPPGNYWIIAAAFKIFGTGVGVERGIGIIYRLAFSLGIYLCTLPRGKLVAAAGALLGGWASTQGSVSAYAWSGAMACAMLSLALLSIQVRREQGRQFLLAVAGALAGLTAVARSDSPAIAVVLASVPLLIFATWKGRIIYAAAWFTGALPLIGHALRVGVSVMFDNLFYEPVVLANPGRRLPLPPLEPLLASMFYLTLGLCALVAVATIVTFVRRRGHWRWLCMSLAIFCLCLMPQAFQRADKEHMLAVSQAAWGIAPFAISFLLEPFFPSPRSGVAQLLAVSLATNCVLIGGGIAFPIITDNWLAALGMRSPSGVYVTHRGRSVPVFSKEFADFLNQLLNAVDALSKDGDRVFVGTADLRFTNLNDVYLYYLLPQLAPAGYYLELDPGLPNRPGSRLPQDVASARVLILNSIYSTPSEPNASRNPGPDDANLVVQSEFDLEARGGPFLIYQKKAGRH